MKADPPRESRLLVGGRGVDLPCFIPSISSLKVDLCPCFALELLAATAPPCFLLSAYDIANAHPDEQKQIAALLSSVRSRGSVVFLDSGNYEAYWRGDKQWTVEQFHAVSRQSGFDVCFSFDLQVQHRLGHTAANNAVQAVLRDQALSTCTVVPILHGKAGILPEAARAVAEQLLPLMIAVPERELGCGIVDRAVSVHAIREELDELDLYIPLHILGTGNPLSILVYALAGADSFDGLEWCQAAINHEAYTLLPLHHWDLIAQQTEWSNAGLPYVQSVLLHNLQFYCSFTEVLRELVLEEDWQCSESLHQLPDALTTSAQGVLDRVLRDA